MRDSTDRLRLLYAMLFALVAGALLMTLGNPANRLKADLRADTQGFVLSLEYSAKLVEAPR